MTNFPSYLQPFVRTCRQGHSRLLSSLDSEKAGECPKCKGLLAEPAPIGLSKEEVKELMKDAPDTIDFVTDTGVRDW